MSECDLRKVINDADEQRKDFFGCPLLLAVHLTVEDLVPVRELLEQLERCDKCPERRDERLAKCCKEVRDSIRTPAIRGSKYKEHRRQRHGIQFNNTPLLPLGSHCGSSAQCFEVVLNNIRQNIRQATPTIDLRIQLNRENIHNDPPTEHYI